MGTTYNVEFVKRVVALDFRQVGTPLEFKAAGPPGPNKITGDTAATLVGYLVAEDGKVKAVMGIPLADIEDLTDSDDLPEGTTHLYNQISDVDPSMHADRTDMGYTQDSNPSGYYKDLLSNKKLLHVVIGRNDTEENGAIGFEDGRPFYYKDGREQDVLIGIDIQESVNNSINYFPFESALTFRIHSGDSVETGLNGVPLVQGYINASMGAYPADEVLFGGTF